MDWKWRSGQEEGYQEQLGTCLGPGAHGVCRDGEPGGEAGLGSGNVEDQEFGFGQVSFELPVKLQMEAPRRWLDIWTCCPVHSGLHVVHLT